jgi:phenylalanyl-tRNA synthetase beta chain
MHAFDLDRLEGGIVVRTAEAGEEIALLNDQTVTLGEDNLVIADHRGPWPWRASWAAPRPP